MIGTLIFLYILYRILSKNSKDKINSDVFKLIIGSISIMVFLSIIAAILQNPFMLFVALFAFVAYIVKRTQNQNKSNTANKVFEEVHEAFAGKEERVNSRDTYKAAHDYYSAKPISRGKLPKSRKARVKQIKDFDAKYKLYLTDEQVESIVNATYMSEIWKKEVEAMGEKYETVHQWFVGPTAWLRLYIHAFIPQEITSDFAQQHKIAIASFDEVFTFVDSLGNISMSEKISAVNDRFYAQFDDITFMAAFRYLEGKGFKHTLDVATPMSTTSEMDDLIRKYEDMDEAAVAD